MAIKERRQTQEEENPLLEGLRLRRTPEPCAVVIFGASGDLTQRKLIPALHARDPFRDDAWDTLAEGMRYIAADFGDAGAQDRVIRCLADLDEERGTRGN